MTQRLGVMAMTTGLLLVVLSAQSGDRLSLQDLQK